MKKTLYTLSIKINKKMKNKITLALLLLVSAFTFGQSVNSYYFGSPKVENFEFNETTAK